MNFYTNVSRYGNMLLYRGIENGKRVQKKIKYKLIVSGKEKIKSKKVICLDVSYYMMNDLLKIQSASRFVLSVKVIPRSDGSKSATD